MDNYVVYHLHSDFSNAYTNIDSVTNYKDYIARAKELGMTALGFSEHGSVLSWLHKKEEIENAGMKYIHAEEFYVTESLDEKLRDNYHMVLIAKNYDGFLELNKLSSRAFNREDGHFYYVPRITMDELFNTSDNILITTACIGSPLYKGTDEVKNKVVSFLINNKHRVFLELQHHFDAKQIEYNEYLCELSHKHGLKLIAGTDTHALNDLHMEGRAKLQQGNNIFFAEESEWDMTFKSLDELIECYKKQELSIPKEDYMQAIDNTNYMASLIESYEIDRGYKYPKLYENSEEFFKEKIDEAVIEKGINKRDDWNVYKARIESEYNVYRGNNAIDYMLLEYTYKKALREQGVEYGYSRGSVSGSIIAYLLGITDVDSIEHKLNFERFMSPERVSLADIDTDWYDDDRDKVNEYLANKDGLYTCKIVTYNTLDLKGAIKDIARALGMTHDEANSITKVIETKEEEMRKKYPELFKYVDIVRGTIKSVGIHAAGTVVAPFPLEDVIGLCSSKNDEYSVSQLNMKELDSLNYVKLDILGLDTVGLINQTCKLAGIERLTPNNTPNDLDVWEDIKNDTTCIFQWESDMATNFLRKLFSTETLNKIKAQNPNMSYIDLLSIGNGAIRPAGASYRDSLSNGEFKDNGNKAINDYLSSTLGFLVFQEQVMGFLNKFCGFSMGRADLVRRGFAKKTGTDVFIPEIKSGFLKTMTTEYGLTAEEAEKVIVNFLRVIEDASDYLFSLNHSDPYSWMGYICGYLRYHYPLEFLTTAFNIYSTKKKDEEKTAKISQYAARRGISVLPIRFRKSRGDYSFDKETGAIYRGVSSVKGMSEVASEYLYSLKDNTYKCFTELLFDLPKNKVNSGQIEALINLNYFSEFGNINTLLEVYKIFNDKLKCGTLKTIDKEFYDEYVHDGLEFTKKRMPIPYMRDFALKIESNIRERNYPAPPFSYMVEQQEKYLGYVDVVSGKKEDRNLLYVKDTVPLVAKATKETWAYAIYVQSIGTGKIARLTVRSYLYMKKPIFKGMLIRAETNNVKKNKAGFWDLLDYEEVKNI